MKISIGRSRKSLRPFDKTHDVNTTADWGFMAPTLCDEIVGGSKISFQANTFARLSPLVAPTFGRAIVKHYGYFVPIRDVQMNYENLMSGTIYSGGSESYIPNSVITTCNAALTRILLGGDFSRCKVYPRTSEQVSKDSVPLTPSLLSDFRRLVLVDSPFFTPQEATQDYESSTPLDCDLYVYTSAHIFCFRLTREGKHLRKIFNGLGYQLNLADTEPRSALPLFAYYKGWFDLFAIKRETNWQSTKAYYLIQKFSLKNITTLDFSDQNLEDFFEDLSNCYYVENPNYFTAHLNKFASMESGVRPSFTTGYSYGTETVDSVRVSGDSAPSVSNSSNGVAIRMAQIMLKWVNRNTAIGQRVAAYFAAHGLGDVDDNKDVDFIGACSFNCDFDDVMSTSDTLVQGTDNGSSLGEYAGKGSASGSSERFKYHARSSGFFIVYTTVVPRAGFVQGNAPYLRHISRFTFFNPEFEAMFMQVTPKTDVFGACDTLSSSQYRMGNFGIIPSYSEYKYRNNYAGGDLTLRSTRTSMLPYILDRWFTPAELVKVSENTSSWTLRFFEGLTPQVNDEMRYIGRSQLYGNFDRIFQQYDAFDEGRANDPFILHNVFNYVVSQPMLPLKQSFDTDAEGDSMTIEKA